ncbi:MAG TPA: PEP-CTERM sorting domain-containing protein [Pirellulales bacterium]|jgi:hypothetical protein|nr:PEP-CTERM sorting domain-containing protein [Pirellulales bacterium]
MASPFVPSLNLARGRSNIVGRGMSAALAAWMLLVGSSAQADLMDVGTGLTLTWNLGSQPTVSNYLTVPIINTNTSDPRQLSGWSVVLHVVPEAGATGTITIDAATVAYPSNEVISSPYPASQPATQTGLVGMMSSSDLLIDSVNLSGQNSVPGSPGAGMFEVQFTASSNASGVFDLQVYNKSNGDWTYWADQDNNITQFANTPTNNLSVLDIGTITVQPAPEPGTLLLSLVACGALGSCRWRRRKTAARAEPLGEPIGTGPPGLIVQQLDG